MRLKRSTLTRPPVILLGIVAILLIAGVFASVSNKNSPEPSQNRVSSFQRDFIPVTETINIGDSRFMSPCQVLPLRSVEKTLGDLGAQAFISEVSLDEPTTNFNSNSIRASCTYHSRGDTVSTLSLETTQYTTVNEAKKLNRIFLKSSDQLDQTINEYKQLANNAKDNTAAQKLVEKMQESKNKYQQYENAILDEELEPLKHNGMILPDLFKSSYVILYNNVVYKLALSYKNSPDVTAQQLADIYDLYSTIIKNADRSSLSQRPAPTIIGDQNTVGKTKIIDSCTVLSPKIFQDLTGQAQNEPFERTTLPKNISKTRVNDKDGNSRVVAYSNSCTRKSEAKGAEKDRTTSIRLSLSHAKDVQDAKSWLARSSEGSSQPTQLQTTADEAILVANPIKPSDGPFYFFRIGNYVGQITYDTMVSGGLSSPITFEPGSEEQVVATINAVSNKIKDQQ
jgi:hypothetical protein